MNATKQRLYGWKEIAQYFSRSVRCVQRWERTERLPVHRHSHARGSTVYAFLKELETWQSIDRAGELNSLPPRRKQETLSPQTVRAADLQTIAHQIALFFLSATRNASAIRGGDRRAPAQSVQ